MKSTVAEVFGVPACEGNKFGVEIELEGSGFVPCRNWSTTRDGSLGDNGIEYVTNTPFTISEAYQALDNLQESFAKHGTKIKENVRAGVHIHMNVSDLSLKEMFQIITLYTLFEGPLVHFCGKERVNNLFCLRSSDAYGFCAAVEGAIQHDLGYLGYHDIRYASLNTNSLYKFGTLEFRAMRSCKEFTPIKTWMKLLFRLKKVAIKYDNPQEIVQDYSALGAHGLCERVFGDKYKLVLDCEDMDGLLNTGMRNAQDIAYATPDWDQWAAKF